MAYIDDFYNGNYPASYDVTCADSTSSWRDCAPSQPNTMRDDHLHQRFQVRVGQALVLIPYEVAMRGGVHHIDDRPRSARKELVCNSETQDVTTPEDSCNNVNKRKDKELYICSEHLWK